MKVTQKLLDKYNDKTKLRKRPLSLVIERADTEGDIENMLFELDGYYTPYICDECDAPMIREFSPFDYDATKDNDGEIYRCLNGHKFQVGGKFFSGMRRIDNEGGN